MCYPGALINIYIVGMTFDCSPLLVVSNMKERPSFFSQMWVKSDHLCTANMHTVCTSATDVLSNRCSDGFTISIGEQQHLCLPCCEVELSQVLQNSVSATLYSDREICPMANRT